MFRWILMLRKLFAPFLGRRLRMRPLPGSPRVGPKARRPRATVKPVVEGLTERVLPSVSTPLPPPTSLALVSQASPAPLPPVAGVMARVASAKDQWAHLVTTLQGELTSARAAISQEVAQLTAYVLQRWENSVGLSPTTPSQPPATTASQSGSGTGSGAVTTAHSAAAQPTAAVTPKVGSGSGTGATMTAHESAVKHGMLPMAGSGSSGSGGGSGSVPGDKYEWDPLPSHAGSASTGSGSYVGDLLASNWHNWLKNGYQQYENQNPTTPGYKPGDRVLLGDPLATYGSMPIEWDDPKFSTMQLINYKALQTIDAGVTVELTGENGGTSLMMNGNSTLNLDFKDSKSTFQIDANATITNMALGGNPGASFVINGGTTTIAQAGGYTDNIGVNFTVMGGATLNDQSYNALKFTNNNLTFTAGQTHFSLPIIGYPWSTSSKKAISRAAS